MMSTLKGEGATGKAKMRCYWTWRVEGVLANFLDIESLFLLKEIGFAPWPDIMLSQTLTHLFPMHPFSTPWKHQKTARLLGVEKGCIRKEWVHISLPRNLPFDSDFRQRSHPLMIPLHCLWAKSYNSMHGQFECDRTWFCFVLGFLFSSFTCILWLLLHNLFQFLSCANKIGWLQNDY